jgi:hypothetical protein
MGKNLYIYLILGIIVILSGCKKEDEADRGYPRLNTLDVTNISKEGAVFNAEISNGHGYSVLKYGFVWSEDQNPNLDSSDRVIISSNIESKKFSAQISSTLAEGRIYYVRSFIITKDYTVYGKVAEFVSLGSKAPVLKSFFPLSGTWGDTILISGKNFSYVAEKNIVRMGALNCKLTSVSDTLLKIVVPSYKNESAVKISISVSGNTCVSAAGFTYLIPVISAISPVSATYKDVLQITGSNFGYLKENVTVKFSGITAQIVSVTPGLIRAVVPESLRTMNNVLQITAVGVTITYDKMFILKAPVITSFLPDTVFKPNAPIIIYGENFSPVLQNNKVLIEGFTATIQEAAVSYLKVLLPYESIRYYYTSAFKNISVTVTASEQSTTSAKSLSVWWHSTWTRKRDFPGKGRHDAVAFALNNKGYFGTGVSTVGYELLKDFWEYDPAADNWTQITDFPGNARMASVAFTIGGKGYVGTGSEHYYWSTPSGDSNHFKDFYSFDPVAGSWTRVADFPGIGRHSAAGFAANNAGYIGTGWWGNDGPSNSSMITSDFWKYDPASNSWSAIQSFPNSSYMAVGFNIDNTGYVYDYNYLYRLDGSSWTRLSAPGLGAWNNIAFSINRLAYFGMGEPHEVGGTNAMWEYNPVTQASVNKLIDYNYKRWGASVFVINSKAYVVSGATYLDEEIVLRDVWEFDPSFPKL